MAVSACSDTQEPHAEPEVAPSVETAAEPAAIETDALTYGDAFYVTEFWGGEYPNGVAISEADIVVQARSKMHIDAPQDVTCPLPQNANYHPWNADRVRADDVKFQTVVKKRVITMTADHTIDADSQGAQARATLDLKVGDTLTYLTYLGEGFIIAEYDGGEYSFHEAELYDTAEYSEESSPPQQWLNVKCGDEAGTRGWILYSEALEHTGITGPPLSGYGEAHDLDYEKTPDAISP